MDVGPVLDLEDVAAGKICALASRIEPRDYVDTAAMLDRYAQLMGFARRLDPGLEGRDFADAGRRLDQMPDEAFTSFGLSQRASAGCASSSSAGPARDTDVGKPCLHDAYSVIHKIIRVPECGVVEPLHQRCGAGTQAQHVPPAADLVESGGPR